MIKAQIGAVFVRQILKGDRHPWHLWEAFTFSETPQGFDYWDRFARGGVPLTRPARDNLRMMLEVWESRANYKAAPFGALGAAIVRGVIAGTCAPSELRGAFGWSDTRQGIRYWSRISRGERPVTRYTRRALRNMLAAYDVAQSVRAEAA